MIDAIKKYISNCPYLDEFAAINVNYLVDKINSYSINENSSYNPIVYEDINGNKEMQCKFSFDAKFHWNEEIKNNIDNLKFFENFRNWLEENNNDNIYPTIDGIESISIKALSNGYIFITNSDEAIYRIDCLFSYYKKGGK